MFEQIKEIAYAAFESATRIVEYFVPDPFWQEALISLLIFTWIVMILHFSAKGVRKVESLFTKKEPEKSSRILNVVYTFALLAMVSGGMMTFTVHYQGMMNEMADLREQVEQLEAQNANLQVLYDREVAKNESLASRFESAREQAEGLYDSKVKPTVDHWAGFIKYLME